MVCGVCACKCKDTVNMWPLSAHALRREQCYHHSRFKPPNDTAHRGTI